MSDQCNDYPIDQYGMTLPINIALASMAPAVNSMIDERRLNEATGKKWFQRKTTRDYLRVALTCKNADLRLLAVLRIIRSDDAASNNVFNGLETISRTDSNASVRWVAIRNLYKVDDPRLVRVALDILGHERATANDRQTDGRVRWACLLLLNDCCERGLVMDSERDAVRDVMIRHLTGSYHHDMRFTAAKNLSHFNDKASRAALTQALQDGHIGVELRVMRSLDALVGNDTGGNNRQVRIAGITQ
jgi:hypothetical protein